MFSQYLIIMSRLELLSILAVVLVLFQCLTATFNFDCRRDESTCKNISSVCDTVSGKCKCGDNYDYRCSTYNSSASKITSSSCQTSCNHGKCGTNDTCYCDEDHYGSSCNIERVQIHCTDQEMYINIYPIVNHFDGSIFEIGKETCKIDEDDSSLEHFFYSNLHNHNEIHGLFKMIPHEGNTTCENIENKNQPLPRTYTRTFYLQYSKNFKSATDQIISIGCTIYDNDTFVTSDFLSLNWTDSLISQVTVSKGKLPPIELKATNENDYPVTSVNLGDKMKLKLKMTIEEDSSFYDFEVTTCKARLGQSLSKNITLLDNGCAEQNAAILFYKEIEHSHNDNNVSTTLYMRAFQFAEPITVQQQVVFFHCDISFCYGSCQQPDCVAKGTNRKRRSVSSENQGQVSTVVTVLDPMTEIKDLKDKLQAEVDQRYESPDCLHQPSFIAVIATMGGVLLILLVFCIVITLRLIKSNKKKTGDWKHQLAKLPRLSITQTGR